MFTTSISSIFHVLITKSSSVFLSTCPNYLSIASLIFSLMFATPALTLISSVLIFLLPSSISTFSFLFFLAGFAQRVLLPRSYFHTLENQVTKYETIVNTVIITFLMVIHSCFLHWPTTHANASSVTAGFSKKNKSSCLVNNMTSAILLTTACIQSTHFYEVYILLGPITHIDFHEQVMWQYISCVVVIIDRHLS